MLSVGSLFSGIGGFDLGLERAGMRVVWQCEQDDFCRRVLARHWPGVPCHPDVRALVGEPEGDGRGSRRARRPDPTGARERESERSLPLPVPVPHVDVLCGGFPCQDISLAGKGAGIGGARSGLWGEYARLVRELRPRYVIVENVAALLARGLDVVLADLAALGYDAEWDCLPASAFGAPHRRDRLWLVAYPASGGRGQEQQDVRARESDAQRGSGDVADAERGGRERWTQDEGRRLAVWGASKRREGANEFAGRGAPPSIMADSDSEGRARRWRGDALDAETNEDRQDGEPAGSGRVDGVIQDADECALLPWRVGGRAAQAGGSEWWAVEPGVGRVAHGVPDRLDQLAALGNALVPAIAEWLGRRILEWEGGLT